MGRNSPNLAERRGPARLRRQGAARGPDLPSACARGCGRRPARDGSCRGCRSRSAGIALYFTAAHEPVLSVAAATAIGLCVVALLARRHKFFSIAVVIAAIASGFATATWRTAHLAHVVLAKPLYSVALSGFVETRDIRERTGRFVLHVTDIDVPRGLVKLERVRLSVRKGTAPDVGSFVELKARLQRRSHTCDQAATTLPATSIFRASAPPALPWAPSRRCSRRKKTGSLCTTQPSCRDCAMRSMRGSASRSPAMNGDRDRASHRAARCDHRTRQRRDVHLRSGACLVDLRPSHGCCRRRRVLCRPRAARADPRTCRELPDQNELFSDIAIGWHLQPYR